MNHPFLPKPVTWFLTLLLLTSLMASISSTPANVSGESGQLLALALQPVPSSTATKQTGLRASKELGDFIDGVMADEMKNNHVPGAVVVVVKDGQLILEQAYGFADLEKSVPIDPERTLFRVGSVSKLFVWTAVMQLMEQGKLSLEADVNTYLDFQIPATYPQPITMKDLMSHTAGFEGSDQGLLKHPEERYSLEQYVKRYIPVRVFSPGKIEAYSNYGTALASYIVERISGMTFDDYVKGNLLNPLSMSHSTFQQPLPDGMASDFANGYYLKQGEYVKAGFEYIVPYPIGSLSSTGADMARFMLAHLQNGQLNGSRILAEKTAWQIHSQLFTHDARITGMAYGFYENMINGQRVLSHGGATLIFYSKLCLIPDQNIGFFISTNAPGGAILREVLFQKFMDHYYPAPPQSVQAPAPGFSSRAAPYLGLYCRSANNFSTPEKLMSVLNQLNVSLEANGYLVARAGGQMFQFVEVEPGLWRDRTNANVNIVLYTDENGQSYLLTPEPSPWIKLPWYGTASFHALLIGFGLLLFIVTIIGWTSAALIRRRKRQPSPLLSRLARWTVIIFAVVMIVILAGWIYLLTTPDPAYGEPVITFGYPPLYYVLVELAYLLIGLGAILLVITLRAWARRLWSLPVRLHYSLLTLSALTLIWALWYWNLV